MFTSFEEVQEYVQSKVTEYLPNKEVIIKYSNKLTSNLARCREYKYYYNNKVEITFNKSYILSNLNNSYNVIENTILHELSHAIVGVSNKHNNIWKTKFISIGGNGNTYADMSKVKEFGKLYTYTCKHCGKSFTVRNKYRKKYACSECCKKYNNNKYSEEYILVLEKVVDKNKISC